jgi:hypothetical protein
MMKKRLKLYLTAMRRYNRSKGFGIHSPFAYTFVLRVLREQMGYYAYSDIKTRRNIAGKLAQKVEGKRPKLISMKSAKMLFRIACYFHPERMLQIGTSYGVSTTAMLDVSSTSQLLIYKGVAAHDDVYNSVTGRYRERITACSTLSEAFARYNNECTATGTAPFILVNALDSDADIPTCCDALVAALNIEGTVVLRNLMRSESMANLFTAIAAHIDHGMTFTNSRTAVIVGHRHLPRQRFNLWF